VKTYYKYFVVFVAIAMLLSACATATEAPAPVTTEAPSETESVMPTELKDMTWDQIVAQAKTEGSLVFYSWWGEDFWKTAAQRFEEQYGIHVNVVMADNTVDKLLAEKDQEFGTVDVQLFGGSGVRTAMDANLLYGPIIPLIPDHDKLDPNLSKYQEGTLTDGYLVPMYRNQVGLLYNPDKVPNPPQTWAELEAFIDENPLQFAFCDPNKGGTGQAMVQTVVKNLTGGLDQYMGDTALDPVKLEKWSAVWDWFNKYLSKMTLTASNNESTDTLNQGATSLVLAWDDDTQIAFNKGTLFKGAKIYIPEFGLPGGGDTAGLLKNAPHKAAGLLFIQYLTTLEMQKLLNEMIGSYPARVDVTGFSALLGDDERAKADPWYPNIYKSYGSEEFTKNVLMGGG
jgi:putative spermidine/putrescine transport system substrate-binding protein